MEPILQQLREGTLSPEQATKHIIAEVTGAKYVNCDILKGVFIYLSFSQQKDIIIACIENNLSLPKMDDEINKMPNSEFKPTVLAIFNSGRGLVDPYTDRILKLPNDDCYDVLFALVKQKKSLNNKLETKIFGFSPKKRKKIFILYLRYIDCISFRDSKEAFFNLPYDELIELLWLYNRKCHLDHDDEELLKRKYSEEQINELLSPSSSSWDEWTQNVIDLLNAGGYLFADEDEFILTKVPQDYRSRILHAYNEANEVFASETIKKIETGKLKLPNELKQSADFLKVLNRTKKRAKMPTTRNCLIEH